MKVLLDACVWGGARHELRAADYDVEWVGEWSDNPSDESILAFAYRISSILVTLDKDFGELAIVHKLPHCGIIRLVNQPAKQQAKACLNVLDLYEKELKSGAIITVEPGRIRIRPAGI